MSSAFIDSTVFFAACASATGSSRLLIESGLAGQLFLYFSSLVLLETERNLAQSRPQALGQLLLYRAKPTNIVDPPVDLVRRAMQIVHAKDAAIVAAAAHGHADYLVTLDKRHILSAAGAIASTFGLVVLTPGEMLAHR